jgi:predicted DNA-binding transcriptional regulator AlpA
MKKSKFTEQQIAFALQQAAGGTNLAEVCRKMGISEATFYRWKQPRMIFWSVVMVPPIARLPDPTPSWIPSK